MRLNFLVLNPKPDYQMKFMDVAHQNNTYTHLVEKDGSIHLEKFLKWWFLDYDKVIEELDKPVDKK